jgi:SulP family sulfate permease
MQSVLAMDATGLNALEDIYEKLHRKGKRLILSGPHTQPLLTMQNSGFIDALGEENVCPHLDAALERAREMLSDKASVKTSTTNSAVQIS